MHKYIVSFSRFRRVRDRLGTDEETGRNFIYWGESTQAVEFNGLENPPPVMFTDTEQDALILADTLCKKFPGSIVHIGQTTSVLQSIVPRKIEVRHSKFTEKGLLPV